MSKYIVSDEMVRAANVAYARTTQKETHEESVKIALQAALDVMEKEEVGGWIEWNNPDYNCSPDLPEGTFVATKWRFGKIYEYGMDASLLKWHNITHYRIVKDHVEDKRISGAMQC